MKRAIYILYKLYKSIMIELPNRKKWVKILEQTYHKGEYPSGQ